MVHPCIVVAYSIVVVFVGTVVEGFVSVAVTVAGGFALASVGAVVEGFALVLVGTIVEGAVFVDMAVG